MRGEKVGGLLQPRRITGIDLSGDKAAIIQAKKSWRKLEIENFFVVEKESTGEFPNITNRLKFDIEDLIVVNARMDSVIFTTMDIPPNLKRKEYEEMARIEAARNLASQQKISCPRSLVKQQNGESLQ